MTSLLVSFLRRVFPVEIRSQIYKVESVANNLANQVKHLQVKFIKSVMIEKEREINEKEKKLPEKKD